MATYTPKCPFCKSTNVKKISHFSRGATRGLLFPFGISKMFDSIDKNWHCNNCKRDF